MKPASELGRESNGGQSDARLSRWLFNYDNLLEGRLVRSMRRLTLYWRRRPFRDKLSSQGGLRSPYIRESVWKRWIGLQQFRCHRSRKDNDGVCPFFCPLLLLLLLLLYTFVHLLRDHAHASWSHSLFLIPMYDNSRTYTCTHTGPSARYAKSLNTAVKRRRRVCQYGEHACHAFLSFPLLYESASTRKIEIWTLTLRPKCSSKLFAASFVSPTTSVGGQLPFVHRNQS